MFILNGVVFFIIGLELPEIEQGLRTKGIPLDTAIGYGVLVTAVLIAARMISAYAAMAATYIFRPSVVPRAGSSTRTLLMPLILGWSGMRGVVSLAAALAIPIALDDGTEFPQRNLILFITFVVILLTLVVQGLTLPYFIKRSHVFDYLRDRESKEENKQKMKQGLKLHVHQFLKNKHETELNGHIGMDRLLKLWEERTKAADDIWTHEKTKAIFIEMLESQRQFLAELNKDPTVDEEMIREQLYQIDLEEERLKII